MLLDLDHSVDDQPNREGNFRRDLEYDPVRAEPHRPRKSEPRAQHVSGSGHVQELG